ncbi:hypothetical protein K1T71_015207 [Dendrolimus kikuchii]|nr:hypothetical protein K1T71_015207 [Dendrolimus kikuchii]
MESIHDTMAEMMELFRNKTTAIESQLQKTTNPVTVEGLAAEFTSFKSFMMQALNGLQKQIEMLSSTMDRLEMQSRRKMLLFHGLNEVRNENILLSITEVIKKRLGVSDFTMDGIRRCHRLGRPVQSQKCRPIVVKFQDVSDRDKIWLLKTKLKDSGITMSEFLTKTRHDIFMAARKKFGLSKCWTREGNIYVVGPDDTRHRISSHSDLTKISSDDILKPTNEPTMPAAAKATAAKSKRAVAAKK